jgi:ADP-ribosyl-[dinitrogen reductase] hydrolase
MLGAIAGDVIGSIYEAAPIKTTDFPLFGVGATFTDDTVCTVVIADALLQGQPFDQMLRLWVGRHPDRGYGGMFRRWAMTPGMGPYGSWGNGAAMRVAAIGHLARDPTELLDLAAASAAVSHDHAEAIRGAQAVALAIWLARAGHDPAAIRVRIAERFDYDLGASVAEIRAWYRFDVSCKGTVPPALACALEARSYEEAVRNAVSLGGDSDTLACIAGGIGEALHGLPERIAIETRRRLTPELLAVVDQVYAGSRHADA